MKTRKEIREEYKQKKFRIGIFTIRNVTNNKILLGSTPDLDAKWGTQKFQLNAGMHPCAELQADWIELGEEKFIFQVLDEIVQSDEISDYTKDLKTLEQLWLDKLQPYGDKGYNRQPIK